MKKVLTIALCLLTLSSAFAQTSHKYGVKCAIVKTVTENANGQKSYNTLWFDDYGARERTLTSMDMGGGMGTAEWLYVSLPDGKTYMVDESRKSATATKRIDINYLDMAEDVAKARKARVIGQEKVDGRDCTVWEEKVKQILSTATINSWVWKGIPVKINIDKPKSSTTLLSIEQKSSLPASLFTIPKDYTVKDL